MTCKATAKVTFAVSKGSFLLGSFSILIEEHPSGSAFRMATGLSITQDAGSELSKRGWVRVPCGKMGKPGDLNFHPRFGTCELL